ncbi:MAG: hypothetical protein L0387_19630 [Acidobacteria bacterium]|nr:hypothetical protein [Acidobacteriota bacterium]MCI0721823.1 hypothetical protein [Acidobacteriota bacterium]
MLRQGGKPDGKDGVSKRLRMEFEARLRMLERDYMRRLIATISEFEARSGVRPTIEKDSFSTKKHRKPQP